MEDSIKDIKLEQKIEFKKPVLFGRVGKLPKKAKNDNENTSQEQALDKAVENVSESTSKSTVLSVASKELSIPVPYKQPKWSGLCPEGSEYALEVLKSGMIIENIDLTKKAYYVFGRLANCDVMMAHPAISRHHCVLQYKAFAEENEPPCGWYVYDLGSTHGTFLNKERLKPNHYTRVRVGHQIKFGTSTRTYVVLGPDFDCDGESELSVTEIKQRALEMKLNRENMIRQAIEERERHRAEEEKRKEEQGIDWGMGEDAEEEPDLAENPYAVAANEELYLEDPKKTLRGYFEREGHELTYDCEERGVGQFLCRVELPIDDARGRPVVAEVIHKGKKKEAVIACALEACRVLDRAGLLRQAKHESRRRKERDWSADDYYDSDDDTFLDRTGSVERKRKLRMQKQGVEEKVENRPRTYDDLLKEITDIENKLASEERSLERLRRSTSTGNQPSEEEDALDEFMKTLGKHSMAEKAEISKTKMTIQKLKAELSKTQRLAELARPAHLPPLIKKDEKVIKQASNSVVYGKRIRLKEDAQKRPKIRPEKKQEDSEFVEEMDSDEEEIKEQKTEKNTEVAENKSTEDTSSIKEKNVNAEVKKVYGPMRPPENYVIPESYFDQESDRDLPEIMEKE